MDPHRSARTLFLLLVLCGVACAQTFDYQTQREQLMSLDGKWRFHTGDDPRWADPNFDDRGWSLLRSDQNWGEQGYKGYGGVGWYRFEIQAIGDQPSALLVPSVRDAYQVFANGQLLGGIGKLPPNPEFHGRLWAVYQMPKSRASHNLSVAIRVWRTPLFAKYFGGGLVKGSLVGEPSLVASRLREHNIERAWSLIDTLLICILETLAGFAALGLYLLRRSEPEYLWYALARLLSAFLGWFVLYQASASIPTGIAWLILAIESSSRLFDVLFFSRIFQARRSWFYWSALVGIALNYVGYNLFQHGYISLVFGDPISYVTEFLLYSWILWAAWQGVRRGLLDARLLLGPLTLLGVITLSTSAIADLPALGISTPEFLLPLTRGFNIGTLHLIPQKVTELLVLLAVLAILIARFARTRRDEEQHVRELEAARTVQQVLVPDETPAIPGFSIASVYRPAQQVGGDFFQVLNMATGGALVAIGDVSGKGLPAAMTVSLIVGALRTLAEQTESPAAILEGLNRRLVGRSGFTTCLIALLRPDGESLLANAGHLPPYRNGEEITITSSLPLGISPDVDYTDLPLTLYPEDRLTFVSDGVVEAKNAKGELFGFDRTRSNSMQTAEAIATTARQFGQEDDITVLTVEYRPLVMAV